MTVRKATAAKEPPLSGSLAFTEPRYVWVFQCSTQAVLHAATLDRTARNLPKKACRVGEWTLNGQLVVGPQNAPMAGIDIDALKAGIENDGFYLWNAAMEPSPDTLRLMR